MFGLGFGLEFGVSFFFTFWMKQMFSSSQGRVLLEKGATRMMNLATMPSFSIWGLLFRNACLLRERKQKHLRSAALCVAVHRGQRACDLRYSTRWSFCICDHLQETGATVFHWCTPCAEGGKGLHQPVQRHCESTRAEFADFLQTVKAEPFRAQVNSSQGGCPLSQVVSLCQKHNGLTTG